MNKIEKCYSLLKTPLYYKSNIIKHKKVKNAKILWYLLQNFKKTNKYREKNRFNLKLNMDYVV